MEFGLVDKNVFEGYAFKVEHFLTAERGSKILYALTIMQQLGIDFMLKNNMEDILRQKGVIA